MLSLKTAVTDVLVGTSISLFAGLVEVTVGAIRSAAAPVVKLHVFAAAIALPAASLAPVVIIAV
jgi:hypothetical protein